MKDQRVLEVGHGTTGGAWRRISAGVTITGTYAAERQRAVLCLAESQEKERAVDAIHATHAFAQSAGDAAGAKPEDQLRRGLEGANEALAFESRGRADVAIAAASFHCEGVSFLGIGGGTIAAWDERGVTTLESAADTRSVPTGHGLDGYSIRRTRVSAGSYPGVPGEASTIVLGTCLLSALDEEALEGCRRLHLSAARSADWIAREVHERTRDRRPGAHVLVVTMRKDGES